MRNSGHSVGCEVGCSCEEVVDCADRTWRPKRRSHSGPDRYVMVAISVQMPDVSTNFRIEKDRLVERTSSKLHARMGGQIVIVKTGIPIGIGHEDCAAMSDIRREKRAVKEDIPLRCAYLIAMAEGLLLAVPLILATFPTRSGWSQPAAMLCIPPMEQPTLAYSL